MKKGTIRPVISVFKRNMSDCPNWVCDGRVLLSVAHMQRWKSQLLFRGENTQDERYRIADSEKMENMISSQKEDFRDLVEVIPKPPFINKRYKQEGTSLAYWLKMDRCAYIQPLEEGIKTVYVNAHYWALIKYVLKEPFRVFVTKENERRPIHLYSLNELQFLGFLMPIRYQEGITR